MNHPIPFFKHELYCVLPSLFLQSACESLDVMKACQRPLIHLREHKSHRFIHWKDHNHHTHHFNTHDTQEKSWRCLRTCSSSLTLLLRAWYFLLSTSLVSFCTSWGGPPLSRISVAPEASSTSAASSSASRMWPPKRGGKARPEKSSIIYSTGGIWGNRKPATHNTL